MKQLKDTTRANIKMSIWDHIVNVGNIHKRRPHGTLSWLIRVLSKYAITPQNDCDC